MCVFDINTLGSVSNCLRQIDLDLRDGKEFVFAGHKTGDLSGGPSASHEVKEVMALSGEFGSAFLPQIVFELGATALQVGQAYAVAHLIDVVQRLCFVASADVGFGSHQQYIGIAYDLVIQRAGQVVVWQPDLAQAFDVFVVVEACVATSTFGVVDAPGVGLVGDEGIEVEDGHIPSRVCRVKGIIEILSGQIVAVAISVERSIVLTDSLKTRSSIAFQTDQAAVASALLIGIFNVEDGLRIVLIGGQPK